MKILLSLLFLNFIGPVLGSASPHLRPRDERRQAEEEDHLPQSHVLLDPNNTKMKELLNKGQLRGRLSFDELGLKDERDAQSFCTSLMTNMNVFPDYMDCSCGVRWFIHIDYLCETPLCLPDLNFAGIVEVSNLCVVPSFKGDLFAPTLGLKTESCNAPIDITFNLPLLNNLFPSLFPPWTLSLPQVCATAEHASFNIAKINTCDFRIGDFSCQCSVCESQQDVTLDCSGSGILGPLASLMKFDSCVGLGLLGLDGGYFPSEPFINPLLLLGSDELERRKLIK